MNTAFAFLTLLALSVVSAQQYCPGTSYFHLQSYNISASTLSNKPLTITANDNLDVNVKFVVLEYSSSVQVTVIGQGDSTSTASTIGYSVDSSNGLSISISKVPPSVDSPAAAITLSSFFFLPAILLAYLSGKRSPILIIALAVCSIYLVNADNVCSSGSAGATIIIAIPNGFTFSSNAVSINNGELACEAEDGIFAPICNTILTNPIPASAVPPYDADGKGYVVQWISGGIYAVFDPYGTYFTMFVVTDSGVIVVDAPPTLGNGYLAAVAAVTSQPIKYLVYSHFHTDHIGSANIFNQSGLEVVAHQDVYNAIVLSNSPLGTGRLVPTIVFPNNYTLVLGNETLQLDFFGTMHSEGDTIIYSAAHKVVQFVDIIFSKWSPFRNFAETVYVQGYMKAHQLLLNNYDFDVMVGGHVGFSTRQDVQNSNDLVNAVRTATISALNSTPTPNTGVDKDGHSNPWITFRVYLDRAAQVCVENLQRDNPSFFITFAALDVFAPSHCDAMVRSMRLE